MFVDMLEKINHCEDEAEQIRKNAKLEYRNIVEQAKTEAAKIVSDAEDEARSLYDFYMAKGQAESEKEYSASMDDAAEGSKQLIDQAAARRKQAVDLIVERIEKQCR